MSKKTTPTKTVTVDGKEFIARPLKWKESKAFMAEPDNLASMELAMKFIWPDRMEEIDELDTPDVKTLFEAINDLTYGGKKSPGN